MSDSAKAYTEMHHLGLAVLGAWPERQADYGDAFMELGSRGQYSDIHRKIQKLKRAIWEGQELQGEQVEQIITETIHHLLMMMWLYHEEQK